jgi:glycosyltransferase involved in cell wall biosynthesis
MKLKLSIITINLNNLEGLKKTIESVIHQVYNNYEYIIIDGGSDDGCFELIKENENRLSYWISEEDTGVFQAMNKGIKQARGEYILFLNSGDFLLHDHILSNIFKDDYSEDILCGTSLISKNGNILYESYVPDEFSLQFFCSTNISHQSTFIKKELFNKYGLYREDFHIKSDFEFWIRTIIINNCTTRKLHKYVSDYNLEGISSNPGNLLTAQSEMLKAFESNLSPRVLSDYLQWIEESKEMRIIIWAKSNKALFSLIKFIHSIATLFFRIKSKTRLKKAMNF